MEHLWSLSHSWPSEDTEAAFNTFGKLSCFGLSMQASALITFSESFALTFGFVESHEWSFMLWFEKHLAQQCLPRLQEAPSAASSHPSMLYLKQMFEPSGVLPTPPVG